jgi:hypothetical protein
LFSTYLYTGNGTSQTITNGIDLSGQGGLTWIKKRSAAEDHVLTDTVRGAGNTLFSNLTDANEYDITRLSAFTSSGFSVGGSSRVNQNGNTFVSWTFRKQPKFFDVVTYAGANDGTTFNHNLGSTPGCVIVKATSGVDGWFVYHRSLSSPTSRYLRLDKTDAQAFLGSWISVSDTTVTFPSAAGPTASAGTNYVAYLFAHNAGGFPVSGGGSTNGITCGSYTGNGSSNGPTIDLGYEPQFVMIKAAIDVRTSPESYNNWAMVDVMRGMPNPKTGVGYALGANLSTAEDGGFLAANSTVVPTATGFQITANEAMYNFSGATYIYVAIRRGPMKTPTVGTSVFDPETSSAATGTAITTNFPIDLQISHYRPGADNVWWMDRLRGVNSPGLSNSTAYLLSDNTNAESSTAGVTNSWDNTGFKIGSAFGGASYVYWNFRRAPGFFDEVCYTGTGVIGLQVTHNLTVAPELLIVKRRSSVGEWDVYCSALGATKVLELNSTGASFTADHWNNTTPTSTYFTLYDYGNINASGGTYVAYLFATVAGVSKVGSYTGTGALQTVNCGFTGGARFVLIKRTNTSGSWFVWDTARGMVSGTDPALTLNTTNAEFNADSVYSVATGFQLLASPAEAINTNGDTYIFLAIA